MLGRQVAYSISLAGSTQPSLLADSRSQQPHHKRQAAWSAIEVYLGLDAAPAAAAASAQEEEAALAALSPEERKRFKQRRRKARALALMCR